MLCHELHGIIHVPRFKDENAAELFLGFRIRTVGRDRFAVHPGQSQGGFRPLKRFAATPVSVSAKMIVVFADGQCQPGECHTGTFYQDFVGFDGNGKKHGEAFFELIRTIESRYRVKAPEMIPVD